MNRDRSHSFIEPKTLQSYRGSVFSVYYYSCQKLPGLSRLLSILTILACLLWLLIMTWARYLTMLALWWEEDKLWFTATAASLIGANLVRNVSLNNDYMTVTRLDSTTPIVSNPFLFLHLWFNYLKHHLIYSTLSNKYASHALETIRSQWIWHLGDEKYYHRRRTCWRRPDQVWFPCINDSWYCM